jgi:hypothetical protein
MNARQKSAAAIVLLLVIILIVEFSLIAIGSETISKPIQRYIAINPVSFAIGGIMTGLFVHWTRW